MTPKSSQILNERQSVILDIKQLLGETTLSENEQGVIKKRLLENRSQFEQALQVLLHWVETENKTIDVQGSFTKLEKEEGREIRSFDSVAKILSRDFPQLPKFLLEEYHVEGHQTRVLSGKEFAIIKRIADVIFETTDQTGNDIIIHLEFESRYQSDTKMDSRIMEYRHLMEMDKDFKGKTVLCNVFYFQGSPQHKEVIEERQVKLPTNDPRYAGELNYKAYHLSLMTIDTIVKRNLPFLLPFVVESELQVEVSPEKLTRHLSSLKQQIDDHEQALTKMIGELTPEQMESLRTIVEYLWGRSYSNEVFNKSTLLKLMRERIDLRQNDFQWARAAERAAERVTVKAAVTQMVERGKMTMTREQMEELFILMETLDKKRDEGSVNGTALI